MMDVYNSWAFMENHPAFRDDCVYEGLDIIIAKCDPDTGDYNAEQPERNNETRFVMQLSLFDKDTKEWKPDPMLKVSAKTFEDASSMLAERVRIRLGDYNLTEKELEPGAAIPGEILQVRGNTKALMSSLSTVSGAGAAMAMLELRETRSKLELLESKINLAEVGRPNLKTEHCIVLAVIITAMLIMTVFAFSDIQAIKTALAKNNIKLEYIK